ncbi:MAG: N-methyl-D-aspartate receptor NMDAR2C subunit [Pseudomonadota bacterium]
MDDLQRYWTQTWAGLGLHDPSGPFAAELFQQLCRCYAEPHRRYHTQQHLRECLALCERDGTLAEHPAEVAMALWFHDAIYAHGRDDNERASALWAQRALLDAGADAAVADRVYALVMATCHGATPTTTTADAALLVDIDLSILGATPQRFAEYGQQIRDEYDHVPEELFQTKRREVLASFMARQHIYNTQIYRDRLEAAARRNLTQAMAG